MPNGLFASQKKRTDPKTDASKSGMRVTLLIHPHALPEETVMTENSDVKKRFQSIPIFGEFRFFRQNDHELESSLGGGQLASHG